MPNSIITTCQIQEALAKLTRAVDNKAFYAALSTAKRVTNIAGNSGCGLRAGYRFIRVDGRSNGLGADFEIALIDDLEHSVVYYNMVMSTTLNGRPTAQTWAWRTYGTSHWEALQSIVSKTPFKYIIERFDILISNDLQMGNGEFFWLRQMSDSIADGYSVYYCKALTTKLQPISTQAELDHFVDQCWSGPHEQSQCLALISRSPLSLAPLMEPSKESDRE